MGKDFILLAAVIMLLAFAGGCISSSSQSAAQFRTLAFANSSLSVEMATTPEQIETGLMGRTSLAERSGMLFDMGAAPAYPPTFYMFRTLIPLDVIFLDENLSVVDIQSMTPCLSERADACPRYTSREPARYVLEVNGGFCEKNWIKIGDKARLE